MQKFFQDGRVSAQIKGKGMVLLENLNNNCMFFSEARAKESVLKYAMSTFAGKATQSADKT